MVRWGIVLTLVSLDMVMKAPVWFLIARIQLVDGSTAFFRAQLIDGFVRHFSSWWMIGVQSTYDWGEDMWDLSNQFVAEGETGGLLCFVLFIWLIKICYSKIGAARRALSGNPRREWSMWLLGCAFFAHLNAYFGCSYYDNTQYAWFALLVITIVLTRDTGRWIWQHAETEPLEAVTFASHGWAAAT